MDSRQHPVRKSSQELDELVLDLLLELAYEPPARLVTQAINAFRPGERMTGSEEDSPSAA